MKVIHDIKELGQIRYPVVTSGTFDGVHVGHRKILSQVVEAAQARNGESVVITFWPHPRFVVSTDNKDLKLLSTFEEKCRLIESCGIDYLVTIPFTRSFSELSSEEFVQQYLISAIGTKMLIIGYDHKFGRDREGSFEYLMASQSRYGFELQEIPRQDIDHIGVSSTKIRKALLSGDIPTANHYLSRAYSVTGLVTKGDQIGRKIGFPTANIYVPESYKLIPVDGVYAVWVYVNAEKYPGMVNIGHRPTVDGTKHTIEANIFDFSEDIYGLSIALEFVDLLRKEQKFSSLTELSEALSIDKEMAIEKLKL